MVAWERVWRGVGAGLACLLATLAVGAAEPQPGPTAFKDTKLVEKVEIDPATIRGKAGFYRVGQSKTGHWWLLRPDGVPFVHKAACVVGIVPPNDYGKFVQQKYGQDMKRYTDDSIKIMDDGAFNAFGNWSWIFNPDRSWEQAGWPFVEHFHARHVRKESCIAPTIVDAFDPAWEKAYDAAVQKRCAELRDNRNLLGYFTENEPFWAQAAPDHVWGKGELKAPTLLQVFLAAPAARPGNKFAWDFVLRRHGNSVEQLAKDWGVPFKSEEDFRVQVKDSKPLNTEGYGRDHEDFSVLYVQTVFRVTGEALRKHDPNHLILGVRHAGPVATHGKVIWRAYDKRYVDVLSHNCYNLSWFYQRVDGYAKLCPDWPILVGEFNWCGGAKKPAPERVKEEQERIAVFVEKAFTHPALTGYTWFKFYTGADPDSPRDCGIVTNTMEVNRFHLGVFQSVHPRLEGIKAGVLQARQPPEVKEADTKKDP